MEMRGITVTTISIEPSRSSPVETLRRLPYLTGLLSIATIFLFRFGAALQYIPPRGLSDAWRFISCHFVHWSLPHQFWSLGAFFVLGAICEIRSRRRFAWCVAISALLIPAALLMLQPSLASYRGLSGIDSALFLLAAVPLLPKRPTNDPVTRIAVGVLLLGFVAKLVYEQWNGATVFVATGGVFVPVPLAHLVGSFVGCACALFPMRGRRTGRSLQSR
jgi:rhomboid family GlyGly-CTERM serine protease